MMAGNARRSTLRDGKSLKIQRKSLIVWQIKFPGHQNERMSAVRGHALQGPRIN